MNDTTKIIRRPRFAIVFASVPGRGDIKNQIKADNAKRGEAQTAPDRVCHEQ